MLILEDFLTLGLEPFELLWTNISFVVLPQGENYRHKRQCLYSLYEVGNYFSRNVQTAINICVNELPCHSFVQSSLDASSTELGESLSVFRQWVVIERRSFGSIGFLGYDNLYSYQLGFIGQLLYQSSMRNIHKLLIILFANIDLLFPSLVFTNNESPSPMNQTPINNSS